MYLFASLLFLFNVYAGVDCNKHSIYCHIVKLNPGAPKAMELSNYLYKYSTKYDTDPHISVAIAMQESSLRNRNRYVYGSFVNCEGKRVVRKVATDIGLFQFHVRTIENMNIDSQRLQLDLEYAVEQHVKLLKHKMKVCKSKGIDNTWGCYHSYTKEKRDEYVRKVRRFL